MALGLFTDGAVQRHGVEGIVVNETNDYRVRARLGSVSQDRVVGISRWAHRRVEKVIGMLLAGLH